MIEKPKRQIRIWAMLCHFSALLAWILLSGLVYFGLPLYLPLNVLLPLLIWQFKKSQYPWIDFQGRESLNFQISLTIYTLIIISISLGFMLISFGTAIISNVKTTQINQTLDTLLIVFMVLHGLILVLQLFLVSFASIKAYKGQHYRYPMTIRVLN